MTTIKMTADTSILQFINLDYKFYIYRGWTVYASDTETE